MAYTRTRQGPKHSRATIRIATNDIDLFGEMESDIRDAVEEVGQHVFDTFIEEYVKKYAVLGNSEWYVNTGEFAEAWRMLDIRKTINGIQTALVYDPSGMSENADMWQHASQFKNWGGAAPYLASVLNTVGSTSSLNWNHRDFAYWDEFVKDIFDGGEIDKEFSAYFRL